MNKKLIIVISIIGIILISGMAVAQMISPIYNPQGDVTSSPTFSGLTISGTPIGISSGGTGSNTAQGAARNIKAPYILAKNAIPFIAISSGSVGTNGALSGIVALPAAYTNAYAYFPANSLPGAANTAGWFYTKLTSTVTGTVYNNTYTIGKPSIPASPTAFTGAGPGAYNGVSTEVTGPTTTVPGGSMGLSGCLRTSTSYVYTNTGNTKTPVFRFGGSNGITWWGTNVTTTNETSGVGVICNRGVANSQVTMNQSGASVGFAASANGKQYATVDTNSDTTIVHSAINATPASNNLIIDSYIDELISDGN